jgi:hypothetical protein
MAYEEKKKPSLAEAMAKPKDKPEADEDDSSEFDAAAEELFEAVKDGDAAGFKTALRACMSCK